MIRHCDGNDPHLLKQVENNEYPNGTYYIPCDCGKTFDDVYYLTIYPHEKF